MYSDVSSDSYDTLASTWSNMGSISKSRIADQYAAAAGGYAPSSRKRDEAQEVAVVDMAAVATGKAQEARRVAQFSPRVATKFATRSATAPMKRTTPHHGRSRRNALAHGFKRI